MEGQVVDNAKTEDEKLVCFRIHEQEYAVGIDAVRETLTMKPITRVFLTPAWVLGIVNLRGDIVGILDLAQLMGLPALRADSSSRIVVLRHEDRVAGILVDELSELRRVHPESIEAPPSTLDGDAAELLCGLYTGEDGSVLRVLDLDALFSSNRVTALSRSRE